MYFTKNSPKRQELDQTVQSNDVWDRNIVLSQLDTLSKEAEMGPPYSSKTPISGENQDSCSNQVSP